MDDNRYHSRQTFLISCCYRDTTYTGPDNDDRLTDYSPLSSKTGVVWLVLGRRLLDLLQADGLVLSGKIVVGRKEKHAVALLPAQGR